jgi:hypothetical protein
MITKSILLTLPLLVGTIAQVHAACDDSLVKSFEKKVADTKTVNDATQTANAVTYKVIPPPDIMTKDFVQDRLIIYTDKDNKITSLNCDKGTTTKLQ